MFLSCSGSGQQVVGVFQVMYGVTPVVHPHTNATKMMDMILSCPAGAKHLAPSLMKFFSGTKGVIEVNE